MSLHRWYCLYMDAICAQADCSLPVKSKGLCNAHYLRQRLGKPMDAPLRNSAGMRKEKRRCEVSGCENLRFGHGYCVMHYKRWRKTGDPGSAEPSKGLIKDCTVADCTRPHQANGMCASHWRRWNDSGRGDLPTTPITPKPRGELKGPCMREGCAGTSRGSGYCPKHYGRLRMFMKYGLKSFDEFDAIYGKHGGTCYICSEPLERDGKDTHIDHCHDSGKVRGLLCRGCNNGLGQFRDRPDLLRAAAVYLETC